VLHAPYVRLDVDSPVILEVTDAGGRGALCRVELFDPDGGAITYGRHPITISRAVPPEETIEIDLTSFGSELDEGSLQLSASREVIATLRDGGARYELVAARTGSVRFELAGSPRRPLVLAIVLLDESSATLTVMRDRASAWREIGRVDLPARGSRLWRVPKDIGEGETIALRVGARFAAVLLATGPSGRLEGYAPPID
jgi:hypothetical protein